MSVRYTNTPSRRLRAEPCHSTSRVKTPTGVGLATAVLLILVPAFEASREVSKVRDGEHLSFDSGNSKGVCCRSTVHLRKVHCADIVA